MLSRTRAPESRAAEILRALYPRPRGLGDKITRTSVYDQIADRRAIEGDVMYDLVSYQGVVLRRPSTQGVAKLYQAAQLLVAMGLAVKGARPGVLIITDSGRREAELWFPELAIARIAANSEAGQEDEDEVQEEGA